MNPIDQSEFTKAYNNPKVQITGGNSNFIKGFNDPSTKVPRTGPVFSPNAQALANANPKANLATKTIGKPTAQPKPAIKPPVFSYGMRK